MADHAGQARDPGFILGERDESLTNESVAIEIPLLLGERDENPEPSAPPRNQCEEEVP
jgi:hypothetical protein